MLTKTKLNSMKPGEIIAKGTGKILHPWFNQAKDVVDKNNRTSVKWIAVRGTVSDWTIYHSLGFENSDYFNGTSHLKSDYNMIKQMGSKLTNEEDIKRLVPCDLETLQSYRY